MAWKTLLAPTVLVPRLVTLQSFDLTEVPAPASLSCRQRLLPASWLGALVLSPHLRSRQEQCSLLCSSY